MAGARPGAVPGGPPDATTLRRLVDEGKTDVELAALYGVSDPAIRYWRKKFGITRAAGRVDHRADGAIPWELDTARGHHADPIAKTLRMRNRLRHGLEVSPDYRRRVEQLEADLAAEDLVIDYEREVGFLTRKRDPAVDSPDSIVRMPPT